MSNQGYPSGAEAPVHSEANSGADAASKSKTKSPAARLRQASLWVAIFAMIAAAVICVVWVLLDTQGGVIGRAFLTVLLLTLFALIALLEANVASSRPSWLVVASMLSWVLMLIVGAFFIWMPAPEFLVVNSGQRFLNFLVIVLILQLTLLFVRLYFPAHRRYPTAFTIAVTYLTTVMIVALAVMLIVPLVSFEWLVFYDLYWRVVVSLAILTALGAALVPLFNALFAPKEEQQSGRFLAWPTYPDGRTPLPAGRDGQPDWYSYYASGMPQQPGFPPPLLPPSFPTPGVSVPPSPQAAPYSQPFSPQTQPFAPQGHSVPQAPNAPSFTPTAPQAAPEAHLPGNGWAPAESGDVADDDTAQGRR